MSIKFLITYTAKESSMGMHDKRKGMPHGGPHKEEEEEIRKGSKKMKSKGYARGGQVSYGNTFETAMPKAGPN